MLLTIFFRLTDLGLSTKALCRPSSRYLFLILKAVLLPTPNVFAISVSPFPWFASSRIRALVRDLAFFSPFFIKFVRNFTSLFLRLIFNIRYKKNSKYISDSQLSCHGTSFYRMMQVPFDKRRIEQQKT